MGAVAGAGEGWEAETRPRAAGPDARRSAARRRVFAAAQVAFRGTVLDCVLVDASPGGARVFLREPADVPDLVTLRLPCGQARPMRCRWQTGLLVGFEAVGAALPEVPAA